MWNQYHLAICVLSVNFNKNFKDFKEVFICLNVCLLVCGYIFLPENCMLGYLPGLFPVGCWTLILL